MDALFSQWVSGQPWWLTLLLLPVVVLASMIARIVRYGVLAALGLVALVLAGGAAAWMVRRGRRSRR